MADNGPPPLIRYGFVRERALLCLSQSQHSTAFQKILNQLFFQMILAIGMMAVAILAVVGIIIYNTYQNQVTSGNLSENELMANNVAAFMSEAYALSEELTNAPDILKMETDVRRKGICRCFCNTNQMVF